MADDFNCFRSLKAVDADSSDPSSLCLLSAGEDGALRVSGIISIFFTLLTYLIFYFPYAFHYLGNSILSGFSCHS